MFPISMQIINPMLSGSLTSRGTQEQYDLRFEAARRSTFQNWSLFFSTSPASFAAAGFFYTGILDRVKCFVCQVEISNWSTDRTPMQVHETCSPQCRFVRNEHCGNVPITARSCLRPRRVRKPKNMIYATYESRLKSFTTWPNKCMKSEDLANADFYYNGINDMAVCHHCGIRIEDWSPGEDPWIRHAISSPGCCYILQVHGNQYINNVISQVCFETFEQVSIETTVENHERSHSKNETNEMTLVEKIAVLEQENQKLENARLCMVCRERETTIIFLPCGHLVTCHYCSPAFMKCIICQAEIKAAVRVVFA